MPERMKGGLAFQRASRPGPSRLAGWGVAGHQRWVGGFGGRWGWKGRPGGPSLCEVETAESVALWELQDK